MQAVIEHREEQIEHPRLDATATVNDAIAAHDNSGPHYLARQSRADRVRPAPHRPDAELGELLRRQAETRPRPETGSHPIHGQPPRHRIVHHRSVAPDPIVSVRRDRHMLPGASDRRHRRRTETASIQDHEPESGPRRTPLLTRTSAAVRCRPPRPARAARARARCPKATAHDARTRSSPAPARAPALCRRRSRTARHGDCRA